MKLGITLEGLPQERKELLISATLERACKQCADRGPLANGVLIAFTKMIEKGTLDKQDVEQIIGLLVGRAMLAGPDRKMVKGRRQPFIDLFRIIGRNQTGFVRALKKFVGPGEGRESPIKFVPSHNPNNGAQLEQPKAPIPSYIGPDSEESQPSLLDDDISYSRATSTPTISTIGNAD